MQSDVNTPDCGPGLPPELTGDSPVVRHAADLVRNAAQGDAPVLIVSEPGLDAQRIACAIHSAGPRARTPLVCVDCADPPAIVLQRLFGNNGQRRDDSTVDAGSALARAGSGAVFLASVGEMPAAAQVRLSRVLRDGEMRVGARKVPVRFRLMASSHPGLETDVRERRFRPELYRRLQRNRVDVPPLRDRPGDLPGIIETVLADICRDGAPCELAPAAMTALAALQWPGNLDELRSALSRLVQRTADGVIRQEDVLADLQHAPGRARPAVAIASLREARLSFERDYISRVLEDQGWRMADAARVLGIERANLYRKTRQLGITRPKSPRQS
jgi:DNA-binding NtrC family response regulator